MLRIVVTELTSHAEMLPLKELFELNKDDMSVTRLVSQVDMSPYLASASDASSKYSLTAVDSSLLELNW